MGYRSREQSDCHVCPGCGLILTVKVFYNYKKNFIWAFAADECGASLSFPVKKYVGKRQAKDPFKYGNILLGNL